MAVDALAQSERILTLVFTELFRQNQNQDLQRSLLAECGRTVHRATANVLFRTLVLPDDDAQFGAPETGPASAVVRNGRYASYVQTLIILDPLAKQEPTLFELDDEPDPIRPIPGSRIQSLLAQCSSLEELIWAASVPPPDGICETLSTHSPNLKRFTFAPASNPSIPKWDARSLSLLPPLNYLHLTRLSQAGASALASHPPDVHHLVVDFVWLDDWVCERLARMSRVKRLTVGTGGTKLTDRGVSALVEGLDALEVLELVEVQGRLSKTLWENVELPLSLRTFKIALSESGPHHSWTADHLLSFPSLQGLDQLERISITRTYSGGQVDDVAVAKPVPSDVVEALKGCTRVKHLECDWWAWSTEDLKELIDGCSNLETLRITLDAPFARLLSLTSSFAHMAHLSHLYVTVPVSHAPSTPPSPTLPTPSMSPLRVHGIMIGSPTSSPISLARSFKSPKLVMSALPDEGSPTTSPITPGGAGNMNDTIEVVDCMLPPLRDVRKFMRRCPKLIVLEWFGRTARGTWVAHREDAKSVAGIKVEYVGPGEEDVAGATGVDHPWRVLMDTVGLVPRDESEWTGPEAEVAANAVREYEAERDGEIEREKEARRRRPSVSKRRATVSVVHEVSKPRRRQSSAEVKAKATRARG